MRFLGSRDCYSPPAECTAWRRRAAWIWWHSPITIRSTARSNCSHAHPDRDDVIVGEEVSCRLPDGDIEVHLGVYGMTEALHRDLQPLRRNVVRRGCAACARPGSFFALNHLLHFYRGQIPFDRYLRLLDEVPALEAP